MYIRTQQNSSNCAIFSFTREYLVNSLPMYKYKVILQRCEFLFKKLSYTTFLFNFVICLYVHNSDKDLAQNVNFNVFHNTLVGDVSKNSLHKC